MNTPENIKLDSSTTEPQLAEGDRATSVRSASEVNNAHWLWIAPLAIFCSPIGVIAWMHTYPEYTWTSILGLCLGLCGACFEGMEDNELL